MTWQPEPQLQRWADQAEADVIDDMALEAWGRAMADQGIEDYSDHLRSLDPTTDLRWRYDLASVPTLALPCPCLGGDLFWLPEGTDQPVDVALLGKDHDEFCPVEEAHFNYPPNAILLGRLVRAHYAAIIGTDHPMAPYLEAVWAGGVPGPGQSGTG